MHVERALDDRQRFLTMPDPRQQHYAVLQQAAAWYARLGAHDLSEQDRHKWESWLRQSDEHRKAWGLVEKVGGRFAQFHEPGDRTSALKALQSSASPLMSRRQTLLSMAAVSVAGMLGWKVSENGPTRDSLAGLIADYTTATGETKEIRLADGSPVWLNTASAIDADLSGGARRLHLLTGEILLSGIRKDTLVKTRHGQVQTDSAAFSVRLLGDATCVTVQSGEVSVVANNQRCDVISGQQLTFSTDWLGTPQPASASSTAWTRGVLVAEAMPLGRFINELSRYRHGYLACSDQVASLRVVGTFSIKDTDRALTALSSALPLTIKRTLPWWVTVEARV